MKKVNYKIAVFGLFIILVIASAVVIFSITLKSRNRNRALSIDGIVQSVNYDVKRIPYVKINNIEYYLDAGYDFNDKIETGDTLIKNQNSTLYILKKKNGTVLKFDN